MLATESRVNILAGLGGTVPDLASRKGLPIARKNICGIFIPKCSEGNVHYCHSNIMFFSKRGNLSPPPIEIGSHKRILNT